MSSLLAQADFSRIDPISSVMLPRTDEVIVVFINSELLYFLKVIKIFSDVLSVCSMSQCSAVTSIKCCLLKFFVV